MLNVAKLVTGEINFSKVNTQHIS